MGHTSRADAGLLGIKIGTSIQRETVLEDELVFIVKKKMPKLKHEKQIAGWKLLIKFAFFSQSFS